MGTPISTPDYEKQKQIKRLRLSEDRISDLPESIQLHILSFLPTKFAIQTCIQLSKQWKPLWTSIPCLSFDIEDDNGLRFFTKVLRENKSPWIHTFRVDCSGNSDIPSRSKQLESWINEAVSRKAREIDLVITTHKALFHTFITCETLVVLRLSGGDGFMDIIGFPEWKKPSLPNLKTMVLHSIIFFGEETFSTLVSGCPELENLSFRNVKWVPVGKTFVVNAEKLKNLEIVLPFIVNQVREYEINAPSLEFLDITDSVSHSVSLTNVGRLKKANVRMVNFSSCTSFLDCFKEFRNLESLSLSNPSSNTPLAQITPISFLGDVKLMNLSRLELGSCWYAFLPYLVLRCPNLRVLRLVKDLKATSTSLPANVSSFSQLKVVETEDLWDTKHNLDTLRNILMNGKMLEMVRIRILDVEPEPLSRKDFSTRGGRPREFEEKFLKSEQKCRELERKLRIQQEILGFSRGSTACKITYY